MKHNLSNYFVKTLALAIKDLLKFESHSDKILSEFLANNRKLNHSDRKIAVDTFYAVIRNYFKISQIISTKNPLDVIGIIFIKILKLEPALYENIDIIDFTQLHTLEFKQDNLSNYELPQFIQDKLLLQFPKDYEELAAALNSRAAIDLRINTGKGKLSEVTTILDQENIAYHLSSYSPYAIRLLNGNISPSHPLVSSGRIEFQDESSQLAALLLNPKRGSMVVDFCSGSGGKALFFGMLMRDSGRIYAFDTNQRRLMNLKPRLEKSGLHNIHAEVIADENDSKVLRFKGKIDYVFVDAPCSGLGTLRRNPELKFNLNAEKLATFTEQQHAILTAASKLLKPGATIVYATCSILQEENQDIVNKFLAENPDFSIVSANTVLKNCEKLISREGFLRILPNMGSGDGFFAARLQKATSLRTARWSNLNVIIVQVSLSGQFFLPYLGD